MPLPHIPYPTLIFICWQCVGKILAWKVFCGIVDCTPVPVNVSTSWTFGYRLQNNWHDYLLYQCCCAVMTVCRVIIIWGHNLFESSSSVRDSIQSQSLAGRSHIVRLEPSSVSRGVHVKSVGGPVEDEHGFRWLTLGTLVIELDCMFCYVQIGAKWYFHVTYMHIYKCNLSL